MKIISTNLPTYCILVNSSRIKTCPTIPLPRGITLPEDSYLCHDSLYQDHRVKNSQKPQTKSENCRHTENSAKPSIAAVSVFKPEMPNLIKSAGPSKPENPVNTEIRES